MAWTPRRPPSAMTSDRRSHAAESPSSACGAPPLRYGRCAVTAALVDAAFAIRVLLVRDAAKRPSSITPKDTVANSHRRAERSSLARACAFLPKARLALTASTTITRPRLRGRRSLGVPASTRPIPRAPKGLPPTTAHGEAPPCPTLERAIAIAAEAHTGQVDKAGAPYVLHPLRMMLRLASNEERIVAVLHDVCEDPPRLDFDRLRLESLQGSHPRSARFRHQARRRGL